MNIMMPINLLARATKLREQLQAVDVENFSMLLDGMPRGESREYLECAYASLLVLRNSLSGGPDQEGEKK